MAEKYRIDKQLGAGSYGQCYLVVEKSTGKEYACKVIDKRNLRNESIQSALREGKMMETLKHPFIVGLKEVLTSSSKIMIFMEYADGGDLLKYTKTYGSSFMPEAEVKRIMVQICLALKYLHERNIIHRDLKPENIFMTKSRNVKVGDFGVSKELRSSRDLAQTYIGTPYYLSPEIVRNEAYGCKTDIWSLGVLVHELCSKRPPFEARNLPELLKVITTAKVPQLPRSYSKEFGNLLTAMLNKSASRRPTIKDVLMHPALNKGVRAMLHEGIAMNLTLKAKSIRRIQQPKIVNVALASPRQFPSRPSPQPSPRPSPRPFPEARIFGRDPEPLPPAVILQDYSQREAEKQAVIRELEAKKQEICREPAPLACANEYEEMEKEYKENQLKVLEVEQAIVEGPGEVRRVEMEQVEVRVEPEHQDLQPIVDDPIIPPEPRSSPIPAVAVPKLGHGPDPSVLRRNLTLRLGPDRFQQVYTIIRDLTHHPLFTDNGTSSYRSHLQHLLNVQLQILCVPQVKLLLRLEAR